ncbi:MAG: hypothetical protein HDR03_14965 [Lachnospiraceae bacterium]|nr:hypothetical protein [Lachnospiraceae bacterium]
MTKSAYDSIVSDLANPDKFSEALVRLNDQLTKDEADFITIQADKDKLTNSVNDLRDTNAKLALRITQPVQQTQEVQEVDAWEKFVNNLKEEVQDGGTNK